MVVADEERPFVEALTRAVRRQGGLVVVTKGSQGCLVETAAGGQMVTALPVVDAVDRTGAGDVFAAGLLVGAGRGARRGGRRALRHGGGVVQHRGRRPGGDRPPMRHRAPLAAAALRLRRRPDGGPAAAHHPWPGGAGRGRWS